MPPAAAAPFGGSGGQESQHTEILLQSSSTVAMLQSTAGPGPFVEDVITAVQRQGKWEV